MIRKVTTEWLDDLYTNSYSGDDVKNTDLRILSMIENDVNVIAYSSTADWIVISIYHRKDIATHKLLDRLEVPKDNLTLQQRITYYTLMGSNSNDD